MERPFNVQERGIGESLDFGCRHEWSTPSPSASSGRRPLAHPRIKNIAKSIETLDRECYALEWMPFDRRTMNARKDLEQIVLHLSSNSSGCMRYRHARKSRDLHAATGSNYERSPQAGRVKRIRDSGTLLPGYSADAARRDPEYESRYDRIRDMVKYIESDVNDVEYQRLRNTVRDFRRDNAPSSRNEMCPHAMQTVAKRDRHADKRIGRTPSEGNLGLALRERVLDHVCLNIVNVKDRIESMDRKINGLLDHAARCYDKPAPPVQDNIRVLYQNRNYRQVAVRDHSGSGRRPEEDRLYVRHVYKEYLFEQQQFIDQ